MIPRNFIAQILVVLVTFSISIVRTVAIKFGKFCLYFGKCMYAKAVIRVMHFSKLFVTILEALLSTKQSILVSSASSYHSRGMNFDYELCKVQYIIYLFRDYEISTRAFLRTTDWWIRSTFVP